MTKDMIRVQRLLSKLESKAQLWPAYEKAEWMELRMLLKQGKLSAGQYPRAKKKAA